MSDALLKAMMRNMAGKNRNGSEQGYGSSGNAPVNHLGKRECDMLISIIHGPDREYRGRVTGRASVPSYTPEHGESGSQTACSGGGDLQNRSPSSFGSLEHTFTLEDLAGRNRRSG